MLAESRSCHSVVERIKNTRLNTVSNSPAKVANRVLGGDTIDGPRRGICSKHSCSRTLGPRVRREACLPATSQLAAVLFSTVVNTVIAEVACQPDRL